MKQRENVFLALVAWYLVLRHLLSGQRASRAAFVSRSVHLFLHHTIFSPHTFHSLRIDNLHTAAADGLFPAVTDMKYTGCVCVRSCILQRALMHV